MASDESRFHAEGGVTVSLKLRDILAPMVAAAKASLSADWANVRDYAKPEFKQLAQTLVDITKLAAHQKISAAEAKSVLNIHKNTALMVMLTVEGLGVIAGENAINAALKAVRDTVNKALPFKLL